MLNLNAVAEVIALIFVIAIWAIIVIYVFFTLASVTTDRPEAILKAAVGIISITFIAILLSAMIAGQIMANSQVQSRSTPPRSGVFSFVQKVSSLVYAQT